MGPAHDGEGFVLKQGLGEMVAYSEKSTLAAVGGPTLVKDYVIVITQPPWCGVLSPLSEYTNIAALLPCLACSN